MRSISGSIFHAILSTRSDFSKFSKIVLNLYIFVFFSEENTPAPCGSSRAIACAKAVEGRFADWTEDCKFYYTCNDGLYYGHNPCPEGTYMEDIEMKLQTDIFK